MSSARLNVRASASLMMEEILTAREAQRAQDTHQPGQLDLYWRFLAKKFIDIPTWSDDRGIVVEVVLTANADFQQASQRNINKARAETLDQGEESTQPCGKSPSHGSAQSLWGPLVVFIQLL